MMTKGVRVKQIIARSLADRAGIRRGDCILAINGHLIDDALDYLFHSAARRLRLSIRSRSGNHRTVLIVKREDTQNLGIKVEPFPLRRCRNRCIFCFIDQLPPGLRKELYVKDDDYRHSFLHGNYISATDLTEADVARIVRLRLSPLYVSVHATDPLLRAQMFGRSGLLDILKVLRLFKRHRIAFHAQIVLCPGINDGAALRKTILDLLAFHPALRSIAVVPVGLTKHRSRLAPLRRVTGRFARRFIRELAPLRRAIRDRCGEEILFLSDEFYVLAGRRPPAYRDLKPIPQIENGVGMVAEFYRAFAQIARRLPERVSAARRVGVVTSPLGKSALSRIIRRLNRIRGLCVKPIVVENRLFGKFVTVTGLLAGSDILDALRPLRSFDLFLLPGNCLRPADQLFLDDFSLDALRRKLTVPVSVVEGDAREFVSAILGT
jgi:putative radical SAM enzyme (TIGR03279 family)